MLYIMAYLLPLLIIILTGNIFIKYIKKINFGQQIREYGPKSHLKKSGIPTMGGLLIIFVFLLMSLILIPLNIKVLTILISTFIMALTGFLDDFLKIKFERSLGLKAWQKIILQLISAAVTTYTAVFIAAETVLQIPFLGELQLSLTLKLILSFLVVVGTSNAVNLTDGLDGLAAGVTAAAAFSFAIIFYLLGFNNYLMMMLIMAGAATAFLWFNSNPAEIFMGDVGSLAIGAFLGSTAVLTSTEFFLLLIGGIYVIETLSVIIQVPYYKLTGGKRVFKMTPIHHHFELSGVAENKIVFRFVIITIILGLIAVISLI